MHLDRLEEPSQGHKGKDVMWDISLSVSAAGPHGEGTALFALALEQWSAGGPGAWLFLRVHWLHFVEKTPTSPPVDWERKYIFLKRESKGTS